MVAVAARMMTRAVPSMVSKASAVAPLVTRELGVAAEELGAGIVDDSINRLVEASVDKLAATSRDQLADASATETQSALREALQSENLNKLLKTVVKSVKIVLIHTLALEKNADWLQILMKGLQFVSEQGVVKTARTLERG